MKREGEEERMEGGRGGGEKETGGKRVEKGREGGRQ